MHLTIPKRKQFIIPTFNSNVGILSIPKRNSGIDPYPFIIKSIIQYSDMGEEGIQELEDKIKTINLRGGWMDLDNGDWSFGNYETYRAWLTENFYDAEDYLGDYDLKYFEKAFSVKHPKMYGEIYKVTTEKLDALAKKDSSSDEYKVRAPFNRKISEILYSEDYIKTETMLELFIDALISINGFLDTIHCNISYEMIPFEVMVKGEKIYFYQQG